MCGNALLVEDNDLSGGGTAYDDNDEWVRCGWCKCGESENGSQISIVGWGFIHDS